MRTLQRITAAFPKATTLRTIATRTTTIDTLRRRTSPSHPTKTPPATSSTTPLDLPSNQGVFGTDWRSHFDASDQQHPVDDRLRAFYSTQIYHGQARPSNRRGIHSAGQDRVVSATSPPPPNMNATGGPATGAGTGVLVSAQMFGTEVKGNPTESEADVAADRSDDDPLPPGLHHTIRLGAGDAAPRPTESEEDVVADRGGVDADPLWGKGLKGGR
ncbi:hypothetical protein C8A01DRAFT_16973 [Parachaetomium inaequale]|uniref:Uncharacterized protein n=1 Tax=Parachaetomium inaequale TaxID=2588326 RepID=A0AAN6PHC3_9PEZI|nr:hypothetical protein C8A01DRAFT_16973 [Parachaetomium inaequale]